MQGCSSGHYFWGRPAPWNLGGQKNVWNSARFLTTFEFDREYLRNRFTYRKSEKNLINYNPFHVRRKKDCELWSTNKKVIDLHVDPPKWNFGAISDNFPLWFTRWCCCERNLNHPKLSLQSDLRRRAALRWALPYISSLFFYAFVYFFVCVCLVVAVIVVAVCRLNCKMFLKTPYRRCDVCCRLLGLIQRAFLPRYLQHQWQFGCRRYTWWRVFLRPKFPC